jgi:phospholipase/carboxylesterase
VWLQLGLGRVLPLTSTRCEFAIRCAMRKLQLGELSAYLAGGTDGKGGGDGPVVVLLHGFGAPGHDLVDLAQYVRGPAALRWVFPEAPLLLDGGPGRAWWMIDAELFERRMRGERVDRSDELPPRLPQARAELSSALDGIENELGAKRSDQLLGGFSQGSMLAVDQALHAEVRPKALALLSSTLIASSAWTPRAARSQGLPILQTHGRRDPILPHADAVRLADLLRTHGAALDFVEFEGGHELPPVTLQALGSFLTKHATG